MTYRLIFVLALSFLIFSCTKDQPVKNNDQPTEIIQGDNDVKRSITGLSAKRGLILNTESATTGMVLFQPSASTKTYLMNSNGEIVHQWSCELNSMQSYLLENGHLMRLERDLDFPTFAAGGQAGRIREYDWEGNQIWDFELANEKELIHHDIEIMPNGNILAISYEAKTREEAIEAGMNPEHVPNAGVWPDKIIEIKPTGAEGGKIVWEWSIWDHLVQDFDEAKNNFGVIADHPRKININIQGESQPPLTGEQLAHMKKLGFVTSNATLDNRGSDITHCNAVAYNADLDQIVISSPGYSEIFIIDHSTSTEQAKGSTGGRWGHGGDLLYRYGNSQNYARGQKEDRKLFGQHDVKWIPKGFPGEGHLTVFNNDIENPDNKMPSIFPELMNPYQQDPQISVENFGNYSAIFELAPETDENGSYVLPETGSFGPSEPIWSYMAPDKYSFYSPFVSGAQRLKNGNTYITSGAKGRFFEITSSGEIVWEYWNPYMENYKLPDGSPAQPVGPFMFAQFRSTHFMMDYPAFEGKDLSPISPQPEPFVFVPPPPPPPQPEQDTTH